MSVVHNILQGSVARREYQIRRHTTPRWNRPAGRPRTTWTSQTVRDSGLSADDAWAVAEDRSTWRALRPTAGYAQQ